MHAASAADWPRPCCPWRWRPAACRWRTTSPASRPRPRPTTAPSPIADHQSEEIILEALARVAPGIPVIAEEAVTAGRIPPIGGTFFLVDPLDGTKGFIRGPRRVHHQHRADRRRAGRCSGWSTRRRWPISTSRSAPTRRSTARLEPHAEVASIAACRPTPLRTPVPDPHALRALTSQTHLNSATQRFLDGYNVVERQGRVLLAQVRPDRQGRGRRLSARRADQRMGHGRRPRRAGRGGRLGHHPRRQPAHYGNRDRGFVNPDFVAWAREPLPRTRAV